MNIGIITSYYLNKFNIINYNKFNIFEKIFFSMITGPFIYILILYIIGLFNITYNHMLIIFILYLFLLISIITLIYNILNKNIKFNKLNIKFNYKNILSIILFISYIVIVLYFMSSSITSTINYRDSFTAWAINAKSLFTGGKIYSNLNNYNVLYPFYLKLLYGGYYYFINNLEEYSIKIFPSIYLIIGLFGILGVVIKRHGNVNLTLIILILSLLFYGVDEFVLSTYSDISFMVCYGLGSIYLIEYILDSNSNNIILSGILLASANCIKYEGITLCFINILLIIILLIKNIINKKNINKYILYIISIIYLSISWIILINSLKKYDSFIVKTDRLSLVFNMFKSMSDKIFNNNIILLCISIILIGLFINYHRLNNKNKLYVKILIYFIIGIFISIIINYLFLMPEYAGIVDSFYRYLIRLYIFVIVLISILFSKYDTK